MLRVAVTILRGHSRVAARLYYPRMKHIFFAALAVVVLAVSACGGDTEPQPPATQSSQPEVIEPATTTTAAVSVSSTTAAPAATTTTAVAVSSTTAAPAASTTAAGGEPSPLRVEAELAVAARLAEDAPGGITDEQIACVASATVDALDEERFSEIVAAFDGPSASVLPAGVVSDTERDRIVDAAAGCLPWTQTILESLQDLPDVPPAVLECAQAAAPSAETDRLVADVALFGGELGTVLNLVLPMDCLPQIGGSQADTPAGRLTAAQLMLVGVSPESAACVAEQVDALGGMPSDESDTEADMAAEQATVAMMLGCLTPEEMALLSGPGGSQADTPAGRLTAAQLMLVGVSPESAACVAEQVDALGGMPSDESDTEADMAAEQATVAMMLGCLTPEEMALLSGLDSPEG